MACGAHITLYCPELSVVPSQIVLATSIEHGGWIIEGPTHVLDHFLDTASRVLDGRLWEAGRLELSVKGQEPQTVLVVERWVAGKVFARLVPLDSATPSL